MSEKSLSKNTRKNVILLHIAVMCFSFSGVIGQYVQVPAVQVAMGRVICSSLLLLAISLVCKDKLTLDSKKDYGLMIMTGVVMAIHWSSFFQSIQTSSVAIGTITFSTFPLFLTFLEPLLFHEKIRGRNILNALILLLGGSRETDFDFLETELHQHFEHAALAISTHRFDQGLITVAQIHTTPGWCLGENPRGPLPVR